MEGDEAAVGAAEDAHAVGVEEGVGGEALCDSLLMRVTILFSKLYHVITSY